MSKPFKQVVKNVQGKTALVQSGKGNIYPVTISDYVLIKKEVHVGDTALVKRVNGKYIMVDVEPKVDETDSYLAEIPINDLYGEY